jgi:hypothetical protein
LRKDVDLDFGADPAGVVIRLPQAMRAREGIISAQRAGGVGPIERIGACGIEIAAAGHESGRFVAVAMNEQGRYVGAIHGPLLTAWSMAGIFGPVLVNYIREYNVTHGVPKAQAYNATMYIMAGLLVVGLLCNLYVRAVHERHHMQTETARAAA